MKKILFTILMLWGVVQAQITVPPGYTSINSRYNWLAGAFNALSLPAGSGAPSFTTGQWVRDGAVYLDSVANILYFYSGGAWRSTGTGGGSDTANIPIERAGSGVRSWWDNLDTLMLKDIIGVNFINATTKTDSTLQVALDTGLTAYKDYIKYYSAGGAGNEFIPGSVLFTGDNGYASESNTVFFYDQTNTRLGLGTNAPDVRLHVSGASNSLAAFISTTGSAPETGGFITVGNNDGVVLSAGHRMGGYLWRAMLGSSTYSNSASLEAYAESTHTATSLPTKFKILLTPSGLLERDTVLSLSSAGQLRLDKYTTAGSFTSADTTTLKPMGIDATGNMKRMTYWPGSGGGGSADVLVPVGTNFKIGIANTLNVKGILAGLYANVDSSTSNSVKIGVDTAAMFPVIRSMTGSGSSVILNKSVHTSGTTFTTPSNITTATVFKITLAGGGGGGGGQNTSNGKGGGGGGGGALIAYVTGLSPSTGYTYAIGAAGTGGDATPNNGIIGGNTTITIGATTYTGNGGNPGLANTSGGTGGTATNGDINIQGQSGDSPPGSASGAVAGVGGGSPAFGLGLGAGTRNSGSGNGLNATGYGAGGGGGVGVGASGGNGTAGVIMIEWITGGGGGGGGTYTAGYGLTLPASAFILDTTIAVNKAGAQVIPGAKNYTSASNKFSGLATDNTATKFVVAATDGTLGTQTIQTLSAYTGVDSLMSGQYTPTLANVTNVAGTTAVLVNYQKVGSMVHVQGVGSCTVTASGGTLTTMSITLPFASAMTLVTDCSGSGTARTSAAALPAYVTTNTTTDVAEVSFYSGSGSHDVHFSFTYKVK